MSFRKCLGGAGFILGFTAAMMLATSAVAAEVTFWGEDFEDEFTLFHNDEASEDVILVRSRDCNEFFVLPPGETAIVHPTGMVEGSVPMMSFFANLSGSATGVTYEVTQVENVEQSSQSAGPYTPIAVGDVLTSCMYYRRTTMFTSSMTVTDAATGKTLRMRRSNTIRLIVAHHVPWDPQFQNVNGFEDFADFGYASFSIVGDEGTVTDDSAFNPEGAQLAIHGTYGEALVPQRMGGVGGDGTGAAKPLEDPSDPPATDAEPVNK